MGDKATLAKAKMELEELYLGVPDDSVNLTFQDLAEVRQQQHQHQHQQHLTEKKKSQPLDPISEPLNSPEGKINAKISTNSPSPLAKLPSLDFSKAIEASSMQKNTHFRASTHLRPVEGDLHDVQGHHDHRHHQHHHRGGEERSVFYDDVSQVSGYSVSSMSHYHERGGRRRPGIPHSNICTVCTTYIYIFRHRCLVCGRAYCRQCVTIGMGEMAEGRKCIECLGRRFSQRYIQNAGEVGCCIGYPSTVKQQELKWAEKGPRRSGENRYGGGGRSGIVSSSRNPISPRTPTMTHSTMSISRNPISPRTPTRTRSPSSPPSFVMASPYSPYSPTTHHALPF